MSNAKVLLVVGFVFVPLLFTCGCGSSDNGGGRPVGGISTPDYLPPMPVRAGYRDDLDRLTSITSRINDVLRSSYVVVFGDGRPGANSDIISIDYALFDRLSDDGAAVQVVEAVLAVSDARSPGEHAGRVTSSEVLRVDELAGRYVAAAGFKPDGFSEWLRAQRDVSYGRADYSVPARMRAAAFMRGYISAQIPKSVRESTGQYRRF